jgi:hypothetical protein
LLLAEALTPVHFNFQHWGLEHALGFKPVNQSPSPFRGEGLG